MKMKHITVILLIVATITLFTQIFYVSISIGRRSSMQKYFYSKFTNFTKIKENCGLDGEIWLGTKNKSFDCLKWLASSDEDYNINLNEPLLFHSFLHEFDQNNLHPVIYAFILSFLITQKSDSELWIWTQKITFSRENITGMNNTFVLPKSQRIKLKLISDDTLFLHMQHVEAARKLFQENVVGDAKDSFYNVVYLSDFLRLLLLDLYGGVWVDIDTILLRSFQPLIHNQFAYRYGVQTDNSNNAVIHFKKDSTLLKILINSTYDLQSNVYNPMNLGPGVFERYLHDFLMTERNFVNPTKTEHFIIYPVAYFDPQWIRFEGKEFEEKVDPELGATFVDVMISVFNCSFPDGNIFANFFHGSFAYHCHCYKPHQNLIMEHGSCMDDMIIAMRKSLKIDSFM